MLLIKGLPEEQLWENNWKIHVLKSAVSVFSTIFPEKNLPV